MEVVDRVDKKASAFVDDPKRPSLKHPFRDPETGRDFPSQMTPALMWKFYEVIERYGIDGALELALHCAAMVKHDLTEADTKRLRRMLQDIDGTVTWYGGDQTTLAIDVTYHMLRRGDLKSWEDAARLAMKIIGRDEKIDPATWRKRVSRWAEKQEYPKLALSPGRKANADI